MAAKMHKLDADSFDYCSGQVTQIYAVPNLWSVDKF